MAEFTHVLLDPTARELADALAEAARQANQRCGRDLLGWPPASFNRTLAEIGAQAEGHRRWDSGRREPVSAVALAWWTDHARRKHYQVGGARLDNRLDSPRPLLFYPCEGRSPLPLLYPDFVLEQARGERWEPVAVCPCGASGPPASLGWMGTTCGPCHDRELEGAPARPFCQPTLRLDTRVWSLSFSPGGDLLGIGTVDGLVVRDPASGEERSGLGSRPPRYGQQVLAALTPAGEVLASFGPDRPLSLWDSRRSQWTAVLQAVPIEVAVSPDGRWLAACGAQIQVCDLSNQSALPTRLSAGSSPNVFSSAAFSPDGRFLGATNISHEAIVWEVPSWREVARLRHPADRPRPLAFSPDNSLLAVGANSVRSPEGRQEPRIHVWDVRTQTSLCLLETKYQPACLAFSPDGSRLVAGSYDYLVHVWDTGDFRPLARFDWHQANVVHLAFSPDGRLLATGDYTGEVHLWPAEMLTAASP